MKYFTMIINWLSKMFSNGDEVSSKRVCYVITIVATIVWLSLSLHKSGITDGWVLCLKTLLVATGGTTIAGKAFEKFATQPKSDPTSDLATSDDDSKPEEDK